MKFVEVDEVKAEVDELMNYIKIYSREINGRDINDSDVNFYRFIAKQILFFKKILIAYPKTYFANVLVSDLYSLLINDIKQEIRYYYLNQRSIIENYIRLIEVNDENQSHVTRKSFLDLKSNNQINETDYGKIMNEYKIACSYIHGGPELSGYLVTNFQESIEFKASLGKRKRKSQIAQFIDLINILNYLFLINNLDDIDAAFHRSKVLLKYLMGNNYLQKIIVNC
ncbi:hypothetical protein QT711_14280 [Sporosarcina saromensis]|uniref:Apea-like HEPN domain-containing protein n=1 Tax=Sporosarcina saromensis TaxID=359365 RepID=A0ABU4GBK2_9BACL|nr:hypothetical protein [Sporosarcina saromensis]MDW0114361.1 hypothetical protein [Sporosarcina saromensis]